MKDFSHLQLNYSHLPSDYDQQFRLRLFVVSDLRRGHSTLDIIQHRKNSPWIIEFANARQDGLETEVAYTQFNKAKTDTNTFDVALD